MVEPAAAPFDWSAPVVVAPAAATAARVEEPAAFSAAPSVRFAVDDLPAPAVAARREPAPEFSASLDRLNAGGLAAMSFSTDRANGPAVTSFVGPQASALTPSGAVRDWGYNYDGQLGNNSTTGSHVPVAVLNLSTGVTNVADGGYFSLAVRNGNVFAWGNNTYGQLGNNSTTPSNVPVEVSYNGSFLAGIVQVAAGFASSYALASDGSLYVWGDNSYGELGLGTTTSQYTTPQHLLPPSGQYYELLDSDADGEHVLALLGSTPPVPEPATWLGGALTLSAAATALRRRAPRPQRFAKR